MLISYNWLRRHVDLDGLTAHDVASDLTLSTAEVEGVARFVPELDHVVVGHVVEREPHPDADRLSLCRVDLGAAGEGKLLTIVCGAPNVRAGLKVAVARIGTTLPGDVKLKKTKIRGIESEGMICSERELGLGDEHDGIWELPESVAVGATVAEQLDLADWIIEIDNKSLTHRPDLWGHRGIAGEIAAIRGRRLEPLELTLPALGTGPACPVRIESASCSRYLALPLEGVRAVRSPHWLRALLLAVGQRPIDLLVDVSNFVMLDLGQPNHLFDRAKLAAHGAEGIVVRDARAGETLVTLDGVERKLAADDMLICSGAEPVALAGIMGGELSKVEPGTSSLLLEVATFAPAVVRRTSARLGLRTDASARFEKHLDPTLPLQAAAHLVHVLRGIQPELSLPAPLTDAGTWTDPACEVALRPERVRAVLGAPVSDDEIADILARLGFGVARSGASWTVSVPSARATKDIGVEEDLIEEVGRVYLYGRIEERPLEGVLLPTPQDPRRLFGRRVQDRLAGAARFHEVMTHTFQAEELLGRLGLLELPYVEAVNAVAEGFGRVRRSVTPSLIGLLQDNLRRRDEVRLFELGRGYLPERLDERGTPVEAWELALVWAAPAPGKRARFDAGVLPRLMGVLDDLVASVERPSLVWSPAEREGLEPWAHPGRAAVGRPRSAGAGGTTGRIVARVAALDPRIARELEVEADTAVATVDLAALLAVDEAPRTYEPIPRFPAIKLDVALAVDRSLPAAEARMAIERAGKGLVKATELFDLYEGEQAGEGRKSLAWHVLLQSPDKTLSDKEGQKFLSRLEGEIERLGGLLRRE